MREYIYTLNSDLLKKVINDYIDYVSNPFNERRQNITLTLNGQVINGGEGAKPMPLSEHVDNLPKPKYDIAEAQITAIVQLLYSFSNYSEDGLFTVSSRFLERIAHNYRYIIDTLAYYLVISIQYNYNNNQYDRTQYSINDYSMFHPQRTNTFNKNIQDKIKAIDEYVEECHKQKIQEAIEATSSKFVERYNHNLSQLTIDEESAITHIENNYGNDDEKGKKRKQTVYKICNNEYKKEIRSIDDSGRIYHIGTELERDIKQFTNIEYIIDCKNSHPFLFSYLILKYYIYGNISIDEKYDDELYHLLLYNIIYYLKKNKGIYNHYTFRNDLHKTLENKRLKKSDLAKIDKFLESMEGIPDDVWKYIYHVADGRIWDMFVDEFEEDRTTVKQEVFANVIYAYPIKRIRKRTEEEDRWGKMFNTLYPSVYESINKIKQSLHEQCKSQGRTKKLRHPHVVYINNYRKEYTVKDDVLLPMLLMKLESKIFTQILTKLFNKRIVCFGIHDAVAVIKSNMPEDEVIQVMMGVYGDFGQIPTLSVEHYDTQDNVQS